MLSSSGNIKGPIRNLFVKITVYARKPVRIYTVVNCFAG